LDTLRQPTHGQILFIVSKKEEIARQGNKEGKMGGKAYNVEREIETVLSQEEDPAPSSELVQNPDLVSSGQLSAIDIMEDLLLFE